MILGIIIGVYITGVLFTLGVVWYGIDNDPSAPWPSIAPYIIIGWPITLPMVCISMCGYRLAKWITS